MPNPAREPTFLPLTISASRAQVHAKTVRRKAELTDRAAVNCWLALVAGCSASPVQLIHRLRDLSEATLAYAGLAQIYPVSDIAVATTPAAKLIVAEDQIDMAAQQRDGALFPEAFLTYDHAVATIVATAAHKAAAQSTSIHSAKEAM